MEKEYKLLGFDLDGTIFTDAKELTERTRRALSDAAAAGIHVVPVTGRPLSGIPDVIAGLPGIRYAITSNGARIVDMKERRVLREALVDKEVTGVVLDIFGKYDTIPEFYFDGTAYMSERDFARIDAMAESPAVAVYMKSTRTLVPDVRRTLENLCGGVDKVYATFACQREKEEAFRELGGMEHITVTRGLSNNIEVNARGVDKGAGIRMLGEFLGVRREEIIAFGDGLNDLAMIREAGMGIAVGNAVPEVRRAADHVTGSNEEDGVAEAVERFIFHLYEQEEKRC